MNHLSRTAFLDVKSKPAVQAELLWVYRGKADPLIWSQFVDAPCTVIFVEKGAIELEWEGGSTRCEADDVFLGREGIRRHRVKKGTILFSIGFDFHWSNGLSVFDKGLNLRLVQGRTRSRPCRQLAKVSLKLFQRLHPGRRYISFKESLKDDPGDLFAYSLGKAVSWEWFQELLQALAALKISPAVPGSEDSVVRKVREMLDAWPLDKPFTLEKITPHAAVGWRRVQQLFRKELRVTPRDYFERRRLLQAKARLREAGVSIKEVASELGFQNLPHFSVWFRNRIGKPPRSFQLDR